MFNTFSNSLLPKPTAGEFGRGFHNKVTRWNNEFLYLHHSPVGYTSVPFALGGTGSIFHTNLELAF